MNPQRFVAAVAALAIGFGITIVGVGLADETTAVTPELDRDAGGVEGDEVGGEIDRAEQQEATAEEPVAAEAEPTPSVATETESDQESTRSTCDNLAANGATDDRLIAAGCELAGPAPSSETSARECSDVLEITTRDGRVLVLTEGFSQEGPDEYSFAGAPIGTAQFIRRAVLRRAALTEVDGVFVDCEDEKEFKDTGGPSVREELEVFVSNSTDGGSAENKGSEDGGSTSSDGRSIAPCGVVFSDVADDVSNAEFQKGGGIAAGIGTGSDGAAVTEFDLYLRFMAAVLDQRSSTAPSPGWEENLGLVTEVDQFADVNCDQFEKQYTILQTQFSEVASADAYRTALGVTVCLFGEFSTRSNGGQPPSNEIFTFLAKNGSVGGCQIDPTLTNTET